MRLLILFIFVAVPIAEIAIFVSAKIGAPDFKALMPFSHDLSLNLISFWIEKSPLA